MKNLILLVTICAACQSAPHTAATTPPTSELAARRAQLVSWLHDYYEAGVYPTDAAGLPISVFEDERGVRCPMAELMYRSGHGDLVAAVARDNNKLRLADVKDGPVLDWMMQSGLTIEEIAMVQGAMDIDFAWLNREFPQQETILARGQVRGRLETAERALRDGTSHSLQVAKARLKQRPVRPVLYSTDDRAGLHAAVDGRKP